MFHILDLFHPQLTENADNKIRGKQCKMSALD